MNPLYALFQRIRENELTESDREALLNVVACLGGCERSGEFVESAAYRVAREYLDEVISQ
jgi:hypothetical protein